MTLRVTIEIVPFGDEDNKRTLEVIDISNETYDRTPENDYGQICDYEFISVDDKTWVPVRGTITHHKRSDGYRQLVKRTIQALMDKAVHDKGTSDVE